ncbi:hypothetical protein GCM10010530_75040 [Kribbella aluminosa]
MGPGRAASDVSSHNAADMSSVRRLLAVLANPPLATSGQRTLNRVSLAARLIGCDDVVVGNLFPIASKDVTALGTLGADSDQWLAARDGLLRLLLGADDVLLGWGRAEPAGAARIHHRSQIQWLMTELESRSLQVWTVGGEPRHPSRWQRHTCRAYPGRPFGSALAAALLAGLPAR